MNAPRFSVVVPTKDRPELLGYCLEGLAGLRFDDFEVIVSDNHTRAPADHVFDRWAGEGWSYVVPPEPFPMHGNWEFAVERARGDYVAVVIDKTVLHPSALSFVDDVLAAEPADIVTWWNEGYNPIDEEAALGPGWYWSEFEPAAPAAYDPRAELDRRFSLAERRGVNAVHYFRGKIPFGLFSRRLIDRIRDLTGGVFVALAPDYTSMVPALSIASHALDLGRPLLVSYNSAQSNGRRQEVDPRYARRFIEQVDPSIVAELPIPGLYASVHNAIAYDYVSSARRCQPGTVPQLHVANLLCRAREDLALTEWVDPQERASQYAILEEHERRYGIDITVGPTFGERLKSFAAPRFSRSTRLGRLARRVLGRPAGTRFDSIIDAARAADEHYRVATLGLR